MNRRLTNKLATLFVHWIGIGVLATFLYMSVNKRNETEALLHKQIENNKTLSFLAKKATKDIERTGKYLKHCQDNVDILVGLCMAAIEGKEQQLKACSELCENGLNDR